MRHQASLRARSGSAQEQTTDDGDEGLQSSHGRPTFLSVARATGLAHFTTKQAKSMGHSSQTGEDEI